MAVFAEAGIYLKYGDKPYGKVRDLLWPVLVYRVLYPEVRQPELNLFQRAVLGLMRAKVTHVESIAELTGLHEDLVKLIFAQSISNGWLTERADTLTEKGVRVLEGEEDASANLKAGYLFQDAISGNFWPRFETQLNDIAAKDPQARFPEFLGERRTGKPQRPFVIKASKAPLSVLDNTMLTRAYTEYRNDYRASQQLYGTADLPEQVKLQGVQFLDASPLSARVLVWVTPDENGLHLWTVKDPFDLRDEAWWLDDSLQQLVSKDSNLLSKLSGLVDKPQKENQTVEQWLSAIKNDIDLRVLIEFPWVESQPDIKRYLAGLLERREKMAQGQTGSNDLEAAVMESQKLLEVLMQWLIKEFPADTGQLPKKTQQDRQLNQKILAALQVPAFSDGVIQILSGQNLTQVIRACSSPVSSVKALLFAAALGVLNHPQHPFRILSGEQLQLEKLLELANLRNPSSHAQSKHTGRQVIQLTPEQVQQQIQYSLSFIEYFKEWM